MKKLLMTLLLVLLLIVTCFLIFKNISFAGWTSKSIKNIKEENQQLENQINIAVQKNEQEYPESIKKLEETIEQFEITKAKYDSKIQFASSELGIGIVEIRKYKIETLWIALENYAKEENVKLLLNIVQNPSLENVYNLEIAIVGEYDNIISFLYDIEDSDELNFKIENFEMHQYRVKTTTSDPEQNSGTSEPFNSTTTTTTSPVGKDVVSSATNGEITVDTPPTEEAVSYDPKWVEATFVVNDIQIDNIDGNFN